MSEYMRLKAEAEKLLAQAEAIRSKEVEAEVVDIRKRIIAWGITAEQLFPSLVVGKTRKSARDSQRPSETLLNPPKYAWGGRTWAGMGGPKPKWVSEALLAGVTLAQMEAECLRMREAGLITHPSWENSAAA